MGGRHPPRLIPAPRTATGSAVLSHRPANPNYPNRPTSRRPQQPAAAHLAVPLVSVRKQTPSVPNETEPKHRCKMTEDHGMVWSFLGTARSWWSLIAGVALSTPATSGCGCRTGGALLLPSLTARPLPSDYLRSPIHRTLSISDSQRLPSLTSRTCAVRLGAPFVSIQDLPIDDFQLLVMSELSLDGFEEELRQAAETNPDEAGWVGGHPELEEDTGGLFDDDDGYIPPMTPSDSEEEEEGRDRRSDEEDEQVTAGGPARDQVGACA